MATGIIEVLREYDPQVISGLSFPATTDFTYFKGPNSGKRMLIMCDGAPGANHNNANLGSLALDYTNFKLYIMTAAATWVVVGSQI